jgi:RNA polymerase subunit RPABC4/transcription elongation factor Spt4
MPVDSPEAGSLADMGSEIADPELLRAFRRTAGTMARRRRFFLAKGYRLCRDCGCVYPKEKAECPACKLKRESAGYARAIAILDQRPEVGSEELSRLAGLPDPWLCERARREVESRLVTYIRYRLAAAARDAESDRLSWRRSSPEARASRAEVAAAVKKLASLRSLMPFESMSVEDLETAVGRRYASLARKG